MTKAKSPRPKKIADIWTRVDDYIVDNLLADDAALDAALRSSIAAGLPAIAVTPAQGRFLQLLAEMIRARSVLEIGTLGGYSTICFARALPPDGRIVTPKSTRGTPKLQERISAAPVCRG